MRGLVGITILYMYLVIKKEALYASFYPKKPYFILLRMSHTPKITPARNIANKMSAKAGIVKVIIIVSI